MQKYKFTNNLHQLGYKRVIVIGIDGAGQFIKKVHTPTLDKFFSLGSKSFKAKAVIPTDSAQNWGSMLTGVLPTRHNLKHEELEKEKPYPEDSPYPSIFKILSNRNSNIKMASYVGWWPINTGIIEMSVKMDRYSPLTHEDEFRKKQLIFEHQKNKNSIYDKDVILRLREYILDSRNKDTEFLFVHLVDVDEHGHDYGFGSLQHLEQIRVADSQIAQILDAIRKVGWENSSLVIITTDHGGIFKKHGGDSQQETDVFLAVKGLGIKPNSNIAGKVTNMDCAAIVLKALSKQDNPDYFDAKLPSIPLKEKLN